MTNLSFSDTRLTGPEFTELFRLSRKNRLKNKYYDRLHRLGFADDDFVIQTISDKCSKSGNELAHITDRGIDFLRYKRGFFWPEFRNWVSLIIAVAAFVKSFFF